MDEWASGKWEHNNIQRKGQDEKRGGLREVSKPSSSPTSENYIPGKGPETRNGKMEDR